MDEKYSKLRPVKAGTPQGSVLGTYMFNVGTDTHEDGFEQQTDAEKTTLLAVSTGTSYRAKTHIYDGENNRIDCLTKLKALGFIFNQEVDVSDQVESLCKRLCTRTWTL